MAVWFVKDCCGMGCILLAWLMIAYGHYALLEIVILPKLREFKSTGDTSKQVLQYLHIITFEFFSALAIISHLRTIFTDPGSVPQDTATPELMREITSNGLPCHVVYKCSECCSVKPDRAHHCSVCKRCVRKMDHHCPWVNNCVGERNQKFFVLFTFYVTIISTHALVLSLNHFLECLWNPTSLCPMTRFNGKQSPENMIMLVFLIFETLLFSLFGFIVLGIQLKAIWSDWTGIENLKKETRDRQSGCTSLKTVLGDNLLLWFSPLTQAPAKNKSFYDSPNRYQNSDYSV